MFRKEKDSSDTFGSIGFMDSLKNIFEIESVK